MSNKLKIKDLVSIGVFFVIYFVVMFTVGMVGLVPILFLCYPFIGGIVMGTIVMLFMAKVPKPWALFIFGMLSPLLMFAMGHTFVVPLVSLIFMSLAEVFFRKGGFKSFKYNAIAHGFFSCWLAGSFMQMLLLKEKWKAFAGRMSSPEYIAQLEALISWQSMVLIILGGFAGGIIGAFIGKAMLKKHFQKAGIV